MGHPQQAALVIAEEAQGFFPGSVFCGGVEQGLKTRTLFRELAQVEFLVEEDVGQRWLVWHR
jgi:hypothetical protein